MKPLKPILLILVAYLFAVWAVSTATGHMAHIGDDRLLFSSPDSWGYRALADFYSFGDGEPPASELIRLRPLVYPCFLAIYRLTGAAAFQVLQFALNLLTLWFIYSTVAHATKRRWIATVCAGLMAITPTFSFMAFHAMSEPLGVFLCALFLYFGCLAYIQRHTGYLVSSGLVLSLLVCTKPVALPFLIVFGAVVAARLVTRGLRKRAVHLLFALATPLIIQLATTGFLTGQPTLSTAGSVNFRSRFFPAVYGFAELDRFIGYSSEEATQARSLYPEELSQVKYVLSHPISTLRTAGILLLNEHLTAATNFAWLPRVLGREYGAMSKRVDEYSKHLNKFYLSLHIVFFISIGYLYLLGKRRPDHGSLMILLGSFMWSMLLASVLTYWQGDRLIMLAQPVWLVTYSWFLAQILDKRPGNNDDRTTPDGPP